MVERTANKTYKVNWGDMLRPRIQQMTADEISDHGEDGMSVAQCRLEIEQHFRAVITHARLEIQMARYTPKYVIDEGKYR